MKKLSLPGAIFTSIGSGLGVAIVAYIGFVFAAAGKASVLVLAVGVLMGLMSAAPWFMMSRKAVLKGGQYSLIAENMGPIACGITTYGLLMSSTIFYVTYPSSITNYLVSVFPGLAPYSKVCTIVIALAVCFMLCRDIKFYEKAQGVFTTLLIVALTVFLVLGFVHIAKSGVNVFDFANDPIYSKGGFMGGMSSLPLVVGTMYGYVWVVFYGPVTEKPKKTIPIAIIAGAVVISFLWLALAIVGTNVLPVEQVAGQPLTVVASALMSKPMVVAFVVLGPVMTILTSYIGLIQTPVSALSRGAEEGWLPKIIAKQNKFGRYSMIYIIITALIVVTTILDISITTVLNYTSFVGTITTLLAYCAFFLMPKKHPELFEGGSDKGSFMFAAVLGMIATLITTYFSARNLTSVVLTVTVVLLVIIVVFSYFWNKAGKVTIENNFDLDMDD